MRPFVGLGKGTEHAVGLARTGVSQDSSTSTTSPISQSRFVTPAAMAGVVRSVLWIRTKL
jgi:hypothetical protein